MNKYSITINNHPPQIQYASAAHTAVDRVMGRYSESEFKPAASIKVQFLGKCAVYWDIIADVPFNYSEGGNGGYNRQTIISDIQSADEASQYEKNVAHDHPDYKHVRSVKRTAK